MALDDDDEDDGNDNSVRVIFECRPLPIPANVIPPIFAR